MAILSSAMHRVRSSTCLNYLILEHQYRHLTVHLGPQIYKIFQKLAESDL